MFLLPHVPGTGTTELDPDRILAATAATKPPSGAAWLFELKLDGYRLMLRKNGREVLRGPIDH